MSDLYIELGHNEYGIKLENEVRYGSYKPENISNDVWTSVLGPDVNNYYHMEYTAGIAAWYIEESERLGEPFSKEEQELLMLTAYTHDFSEAIIGDIPQPEKTGSLQEQVEETMAHLAVMESVTPHPYVLSRPVLDVMQDRDPLSRHFQAIEFIGYHETGYRAGQEKHRTSEWGRHHGLSPIQELDLARTLDKLHTEVQGGSFMHLLQNMNDLPVINSYIHGGDQQRLFHE